MDPKTTRLRTDGSVIGDGVVAHFLVRIALREGGPREAPDVHEIEGMVADGLIDAGWTAASITAEQTDGDR